MTNKQLRGDRIIAFAITIQSLLVVLQTVLMSFFHMEAEATTVYRVALTAIPMVAAIIVALFRKPSRIILGYVFALLLLFFSAALHPDNIPFIISQGLRFFLPVVLPSFLCLTVVYNYEVIEKTLYEVSWATMALVLLFIFGFFTGVVSITSYNMAFSFACVLPFVVFYSHRKSYDLLACLLLFIVVLSIGARGPALCMIIFVIIDMFQHKSKWRIVVLVIGISFVFLLPLFIGWLDGLGISSRTLEMLMSGEISSDTGRSSIRRYFVNQIFEHPLFGIGMFGDRLLNDVAYCHNLILEIFLNFGILLGAFIVVFGSVKLISIYRKSNSKNKSYIIKYFCAFLLPFMTSSSYLIDGGFAIFVGLCYLYNKEIIRNVNIAQR